MIKILLKIKNIIRRFELINECQRLKKSGRVLPKNYKKLIFNHPSRYDDFVHILCFIDNNLETNLVDIGGNVGEFSKDFAMFFPHTKKITLFEPLSHLNSEIKKNLSGLDFKIINKAVGSENGFNLISYKKNETKMASFKQYINLNAEKNKIQKPLSQDEIITENIETIRLDDFEIEKRNQYVLKIDVQGFEIETLKGGINTLNKFSLIILECAFTHEYKKTEPSFVEAVKILNKESFYPIIFQGFGNKQSTYAYERDVIFVKQPMLDRIFYKNYNSKIGDFYKDYNNDTNIVICVGMKRSGSTLQFNISRLLLESQKNISNLGEVKSNLLDLTLEQISQNDESQILKVHDPDYAILDKLLLNKKNKVLYTYRDLRSVFASMKLRSNISVDEFITDMKLHLKLFSKLKTDKRILFQKYEIFFNNNIKNIEEISEFLEIKNKDEKLFQDISNNLDNLNKFTKSNLLNLKKLITIIYRIVIKITPKTLINLIKYIIPLNNLTSFFKKIIHDQETLMDFDHFSSTKGSIDAWKSILTDHEIQKIEAQFGDWLKEHGYL